MGIFVPMNHKALSTLLWFFLCSTVSYGDPSDIACLKGIKQSLQDPFNNLQMWSFKSNKEGFICRFTGVECWNEDQSRVMTLKLANMGLQGEFPKGLEYCSSMQNLNLSNNQLSGPIPFDIGNKFPYLILLDLSSNNFTGKIPSSLSACKFLTVLRLDNNRLKGRIPQQLGDLYRLTGFSVTNNLLSGRIPNFAGVFSNPDSFANNPGLCGAPLEDCIGKSQEIINVVIFGVMVYVVVTILSSWCWYRLLFAKKNSKNKRGQRSSRQAR